MAYDIIATEPEEPIRAELFSLERLEQHAESLAKAQKVAIGIRHKKPLPHRLRENERVLDASYRVIAKAAHDRRPITPAGEWLLDNYHIVAAQIREVRNDLPPDYYRELPKLAEGHLAGYPRVYGIAWAVVAHTDSDFDLERLTRFVTAYQRVEPLTIGELWAIAITLRLTLIENLRRLGVATASRTHETDRADLIVERTLSGNETTEAIIRGLSAEPVRAATVARLEQRLRDQGPDALEVLRWLEGTIAGSGQSAEQLVREEIQAQGAANVSVRNIITSMRAISDVDWVDFVESVSLVDQILAGGSAFGAMEIATRNRYRRAVEKLARYAPRSEIQVAAAAIDQTQRAARAGKPASRRDPGFYLIGQGRAAFEREIGYRPALGDRLRRRFAATGLGGYVSALAILTLALAIGMTFAVVHARPVWLAVSALLALMPASDLAMALVNRIVTDRWGPSPLPGMDLRDGVPNTGKTLLVVPALLSSMQEIEELANTLEVHFLSNGERNIGFALLSDWVDSDSERTAEDDKLLDAAIAAIDALNKRYGMRAFLLLHRKRQWNAAQGKWMGWERKRGKLHELNRFLRGDRDTTFIIGGAEIYALVKDVRYVITLDSDTRLPRGAARRLIGKMMHPLNTPVIDPDLCRVVEGHGILQPRVTPSLPSAADVSLFQWAFSGPNGLDPYAFAVSDVYQDLFSEGSYVGKGIYDVDTFETVLRQRIPENTVLSHDLLEGSFARAALASDVEVVEEFPSAYDVEVKRQHRWMRGDWQLLPWIFASGRDEAGGKRSHIPPLARWKMLDNLRRALSAPAMLLAFLYGWTLPWPQSAWWTLFLLAAIAAPPFLPIALSLLPQHLGVSRRAHMRNLARDTMLSLTQILFIVAFMARAAWLALDAMCRTLFRLFVSGRYMLQWVSFAHSQYGRKAGGKGFALQLAGAFSFAAVAAGIIFALQPENLIAAPFLALWAFSPAIARWASEAPEIQNDLRIDAHDETALRLIARETWRFFETFVNAESNFLPPDNFQEDPKPLVAQRTSPTNIGLYLMSVVAARDFGWIGTDEAVERIEATLGTLKKLEWYRGHLLNWYENTELASLHPRYVSSVDSGNFAGNLLVLAEVCRETIERTPPVDRLRGAADNIALLRRAVKRAPAQRDTTALSGALDSLERGLRDAAHRDLDLETLAPHIDAIAVAGAGDDEIGVCARALRDWLASHHRDQQGATDTARIAAIAEWCEQTVRAMDFGFLQHRDRQLLSIGFRVDDQALDANAYDLLASEARLATFLAVAKGDIPTRNWFRLGRALIPLRHGSALLSWSGSMFEYLMPSLLMHEPEGSILSQSNRLAVEQQISYGHRRGIPWGISESQFNARDRAQNYQYSGFGVPSLGLKRGLSENVVISPYATGLAVMVKPRAALRNFARLTAAGAKGRYGFYEALDYTRARVPEGAQVAIVRSFMAHHQAMVMVAIANVVLDGRMRRRFHAEPMVRATELLLQERMPRDVPVSRPPPQIETGAVEQFQYAPPAQRRLATPYTAIPRTHLMSNGRYSMMLTAAGSGYSQWNGVAITRWREDTTRDQWGSFVYIRDARSGASWSAGFQPTCAEPESYEALFCEDRANYSRSDVALTTAMEIIVSPEDDAEVRRISITNHGTRTREIDVTSYAELALARPADDAAHPVFSKMFVQTEFDPGLGALFATRRKRSTTDPAIWAAHLSVVEGETVGEVQYETDRGRFLSRGRTARAPAAIVEGWPLSNTVGAVLDPVFSLRRRVVIPRGKTVRVAFWTMVGSTREEVVDLADKHHDGLSYTRAATMAATHGHAQLQYQGIGTDEAHLFQSLANWVLYSDHALRCSHDVLSRGGRPASSLWAMGISGDLPIVILRTDDASDIGMARQLLQAHAYWRSKQLAVDVVLLNERASSYAQDLQNGLDALARNVDRSGSQPGNVYMVRADLMGTEAREALLAAARVVLSPRRGTLAEQVLRALEEKAAPPARPRRITLPDKAAETSSPPLPALEFDNGFGGFADDGRTYVIAMESGQTPPAPWINVIANAQFGFQVSAQGSSFTWARNSQQNQITGWSNDPVSNESSEILYLCDLETGELWTPTACPIRDSNGRYVARHGQGYSRFDCAGNGITSELTMFAALNDPVKISRLKLTNASGRTRRLSVTAYAEWSLGQQRTRGAPHIITATDPATRVMTARNPWSEDFNRAVAFLDLRGKQMSWTGDRREFLGRNGSPDRPAALASDRPLSGRTGAGHDPCGAMQTVIEIAPGATAECVVILGQGENADAALDLARKYRDADLDKCFAEVTGFWDGLLGTIQVKTPDRAMDLMLNRWLLYQVLACRMWGRAGFYQVSGAYGFRDQLQDSLALCAIRPDVARAQILRAAGRQFPEGDVQHWWLPESGKGIRTRISDDKGWLGYVVAHYLATTGDTAILDEQIPFLEGQTLKPDEGEAFFEPTVSPTTASLYEHMARALDASLATGAHGLPPIGTGDWNDGMNRVGEHGRGESVWLGWFLYDVLSRLAPLAENRGDGKRAASWLLHAAALKESLENNAWDGDWYRRAYYDDGSPLGSVTNSECRIDSIAQSWSVLSRGAQPNRAARAMEALDKYLVRSADEIVLLFNPPFVNTDHDPGYIKGYPAGMRENGGQYTHAALWAVAAFAELGNAAKAHDLYQMISPITRCRNRTAAQRYRLEPYVVAADVYSAPPHVGRGGWSWYTGSASWMYRVGMEWLLGLTIRGDRLIVAPCIPPSWDGFTATIRRGRATYEIAVTNPRHQSTGVAEMYADGLPIDDIVLKDDGKTHHVRVVMGQAQAAIPPQARAAR